MGNELGRSVRARWMLTAVTDYVTYTVSSITMLVLAITVVSLAPIYAHGDNAAGSPVIYDSGVGGERLVQVPVPQQHPATEPACVQTRRWSSVIAHAWLMVFGVPRGLQVVPMEPPGRAHHVGLVLADRDPEPMLAQALLKVAAELDLAAALDDLLRATTAAGG